MRCQVYIPKELEEVLLNDAKKAGVNVSEIIIRILKKNYKTKNSETLDYIALKDIVFFASTFWRKMQNIFGECCISKLEKVARPRLAAILPAT